MGAMRLAPPLALALASVWAAACAGNGAPSPSRPSPATPAAARLVASVALLPLVLDRTVPGDSSAFHLRASEFANLFYQLDCLAETTRCSRPPYEDLWKRSLGGLDDADRAALARFRELRRRYGGRIVREDETSDVGLPLNRPQRQVGARLRLAGFTATSAAQYAANLSFFVDPEDVVAGTAVVNRFAPRFAAWWPSQTAMLARAIEGYAHLFDRADVKAVLGDVARFYRPELPPGFTMDLDLIARPAHGNGTTSAELVGLRGIIEVVEGETPAARFSVILHEIFHAWSAAASYASTVALTERFAASTDEDALAAFGLLEEGLATANGNGRIARLVTPEDYARRLAQPEGLYADPYIDGIAKGLLGAMDRKQPGMESVFADRFVADYMVVFHAAFPKGPPPIARLRPYACFYDKSLQGAYDRLFTVARPGNMASDDTLDANAARETLEKRGRWPLVLLVPSARLDMLRGWTAEIDAATMAKITQRARGASSFVVAARRPSRSNLLVFIAKDDPAMIRLVDAFRARETPFDVLVSD